MSGDGGRVDVSEVWPGEFTTARLRATPLCEADGALFAALYGDADTMAQVGAPLDAEDDLINEWNVAVLGPHFAALLSARDQHDAGPDLERTFEFVQTYDRMTVTQAVHSILMRFS